MSPLDAPAHRIGGGGLFQVPAWASAQWYHLPSNVAASTNQIGNGVLRLYGLYLPQVNIASVNVGISVVGNSGAVFRPTIYADNGQGQPGAVQIDFGTIDVASSTTTTAITGAWAIPYAGLWWVGGVLQNAGTTQPTVYTCATGASVIPIPATWNAAAPTSAATPSCAYSMSGLTAVAAAPSTFTTGNVAGYAPRLIIKTA